MQNGVVETMGGNVTAVEAMVADLGVGLAIGLDCHEGDAARDVLMAYLEPVMDENKNLKATDETYVL